ncbi:MAG: sigma-70 family RNA polymerase sigma factor [Egibacteraceae bacterium]
MTDGRPVLGARSGARRRRTRRDGASLDRYLDQIGVVDLLDAEEEVRLAQAIEAGRAAARRLAPVFAVAPAQRARLREVVAAGVAAREHLIAANLRLVVHVAARQPGASGIALADVIQDGNVGLIEAVDRFDWRRGYRFSTYAAWWIRQSIQRGTVSTASRSIRLPYPLHDAVLRVAAARERLQAVTGRDPSPRELALATRLELRLVKRALDVPPDTLSLHRPLGGCAEAPDLGELVTSCEDSPAEEVTERLYYAAVRRTAAAHLDDRSWRVLCLRFGMDGGDPMTYDAIGAEVGLSRESIRLILKGALAVLRAQLAEGETGEECHLRLPRRRLRQTDPNDPAVPPQAVADPHSLGHGRKVTRSEAVHHSAIY